jgi:hypothetical protein
MKGLRPEPETWFLEMVSTVDCGLAFGFLMKQWGYAMFSGEGSKPHLFSYEWGKPGGEGEGLFMPPLRNHQIARGLWVERHWVG